MKASAAFEQQILRIYELLADSGAEVTWNDHISDPDNPPRTRQIDVTIRRGEMLTLVECRQHKSRQDVQWIECLIGRRISLGAQEVIAVSSSGFTTGALAKARQFGIIARDLQRLTDQEVMNWGQQIDVTLFFYQYSDLEVSLLFSRESVLKIEIETLKSELKRHPCVQSLFNAAAQKLDELKLIASEEQGRTVEFGLKIEFDDLRLCGEPVLGAGFTGKARLIPLKAAAPVVCAYGEPNKDSEQREAMVQSFPSLGSTSITHRGTTISTFLDLSQVEIPPFWQFRCVETAGEQETEQEAVEFYGLDDKLKVAGKGLKLRLCSTS